MLLELYILFELIMIGFFVAAFYTKQEIFWALSFVLSGILMYSSYSIQYRAYQFNATLAAYAPTTTLVSYPYLMGINMIFFGLALLLGLFDLFDKYGTNGTRV